MDVRPFLRPRRGGCLRSPGEYLLVVCTVVRGRSSCRTILRGVVRT